MGYLYFRVDQEAMKRKIQDIAASRADVQAMATSVVANLFERAHGSLMKDFLQHKITEEIKNGGGAANISNTLNGKGNLFAFLGFFAGQDPTLDLQALLQNISFHKTSQSRGVIRFVIDNIPTEDAIKDASRMTWGSASWALAMEDGDFQGGADLAHFMFKDWEKARSLSGFQVKGGGLTGGEFSPKRYMSEILENFENRINNSRSKFIA